jgi:hypothetical protein
MLKYYNIKMLLLKYTVLDVIDLRIKIFLFFPPLPVVGVYSLCCLLLSAE